MEKTCATCHITKPIEEFHRSKKSRGGYRIRCKECINKRRLETKPKLSQLNRDIILEKKKSGCICCGYKEYPIALDLHHIDPSTKLYSVSSRVGSAGFKAILAEVDKCIVLCAICHRLLHAGIIQLPEYTIEPTIVNTI